jgi:predicted metalloendopeptidase
LGGNTGNQRFFMGCAQLRQTLMINEAVRMKTLTDLHSPGELRTNGIVRNVDSWYETFGVTQKNASVFGR